MKKILISIAAILMVTACKGRAENSYAEAELEMPDSVKTETVTTVNSIPVGVQELKPGYTYDINQAPGHLVVIDFNADWCAPCRNFAPIFAEAAQQFAGEVEFISVNVEQHQALVQQLGIVSIPYLVFITPDGKLHTWVGFLPQEQFIKAINELKDTSTQAS